MKRLAGMAGVAGLVACLPGCLATTEVAAGAMVACDWSFTRNTRSHTELEEGNSILGRQPSAHRVDAYFAAMAVLATELGLVIPRKYRPLWFGTVAGAELYANTSNARMPGGHWCR